MMSAGAAATAAVGATGASGLWLFSYNKENYGFDTGMRFGRFMMARGNANAQVAQYREDVQGIVGSSVSKMDTWQGVTTLFLAVGAALSCAGRIGMHGSAPPGWYCALFSGCIFMSVMFNGTSLWLSMHGALRAQCASVALLTRKVRLPIPSIDQLDQARVFGSSFEKQNARDIFRVPFMRHSANAPEMPGDKLPLKGKKAHDPTKEFGSTSRSTVPAWIRDEAVVDKGDGFVGGDGDVHDDHEAPEHFKLLMKAQEEWRDYDVYARITMLYGVCSFLYAVTYYAVGTAIVELRGFWVMWTMPLVFMTAQALILRLDILQTGQQRLPKAEFIGHAAPFFACAGCTIEYRYFYSEASVTAAFGLAILAIGCHLVMALRMLDLAWPDRTHVEEMPDEPGKEWWPASWKVPRSFTKHLWFITPPAKLEPEVSPCLLHEMNDMAENGGGIRYRRGKAHKLAAGAASPRSTEANNAQSPTGSPATLEFGIKRGNDLPWQVTRVIICTAIFQWCFIIGTTSVEIILGPESLLKPPGEPPWIRDQKYRHYTPAMVHLSNGTTLPDQYRLFAASKAFYVSNKVVMAGAAHSDVGYGHASSADHTNEHADTAHGDGHAADAHATDAHADASHATSVDTAHGDAHAADAHADATHAQVDSAHRRLAETPGGAALSELLRLLPELEAVAAEPLPAAEPAATAPAASAAPFMAPGAKVHPVAWPALFEPRHVLCRPGADGAAHVVALTPRGVGASATLGGEVEVVAEPFALDNLLPFGAIAGAAFTDGGVHVVTARGTHVSCSAANKAWPCRASDVPPLPLAAGAELASAALEDMSATDARIAIIMKNAPQVVSLFRRAAAHWQPIGEVHVPQGFGLRPSLAFANGDLLLTAENGEVYRRNLATGETAAVPPPAGAGREFRATCAPHGDLIRLALSQATGAWKPELLAM